MEYEHQLSNLIYDYLLNRFRFGYYQYGDSLPTVDVFCRLFNVSAHPIWTALRRLRADGYIDMKNGRISAKSLNHKRDFAVWMRRIFLISHS